MLLHVHDINCNLYCKRHKNFVYKGTFQKKGSTNWIAEDKSHSKEINDKAPIRCHGNTSLEAAVRMEIALMKKKRLPKNQMIREALKNFDGTREFHRIVSAIADDIKPGDVKFMEEEKVMVLEVSGDIVKVLCPNDYVEMTRSRWRTLPRRPKLGRGPKGRGIARYHPY